MRSRNLSTASDGRQIPLPLSPVRNQEFLSNHWLEHRLPLEPDWEEHRQAALAALRALIALWRTEKERVSLYGNEAGLEEKFIQPVFERLGWRIKYQSYLDRREPDYALFLSDDDLNAALNAGRTSVGFWSHAAAVADSKAWHVSLDRPTKVGANKEYPPEQIEWYLNHSLRDFGILTNGQIWRLVPRVLGPSKPRFQTYLEVDLPRLLDSLSPSLGQLELERTGREFSDFLRFYLFFSPAGFVSVGGRKPLLVRAVEGSSEYSLGVGEELKDRVFEALRLCVEGFIQHAPNGLTPSDDLQACRAHSLIFLYRLLFVLYAEDRGLLPYRRNRTYTNNRSLARHRDEIARRLEEVNQGFRSSDYPRDGTQLWNDLTDLFDLIDRGHNRYGVQAYNGGLFDLEADTFLATKVLPDWYLARVIDQLGRASQTGHPERGLFRVDYRDLAIQQLGSVYEGLLELQPRYAEEPMRVIRAKGNGAQQELVVPAKADIPRGYADTGIGYPAAAIFLATDKGERRRSGSYYTPDHIVDHIVQRTIGSKCAEIVDKIREEIATTTSALENASDAEKAALCAKLEELETSFDERVLRLRILDPAMGSGHFLIRACQYLAEEIATNPFTSNRGADDLRGDESTITYWKRCVAESCLHGVDANPMAVELAKLALWLETVAVDVPLTFLDHHLRHGDSLIGARISRMDSLPRDQGLLAGQFRQEIGNAIPNLLTPLRDIDAIASDTAEHVKQKEEIYRRRFLPSLRRFSLVGDVWISDATGIALIRSEQYAGILSLIRSPRRFEELINSGWPQQRLKALVEKNLSPFHWELAYPHVFLSTPDENMRGFDVIIGNPPYDVLSEREIGQNIDHLKQFVDLDPTLQASKVGKNNLYKLFILRSLELLTEGGYLGFIVPMTLLGDEQASMLRRQLFSTGCFLETHAFPQKDNPARRVFRDAKLATTLFIYRKGRLTSESDRPFSSQVHPAQYIATSSPSLKLSADTVKLYDPKNLTIVSCSQTDWDLVASLVRHPIGRLGDFVEFFQGEVNQTVATNKGLLTDSSHGPLITRGANLCLYQLREASQGEDIYLNVSDFLDGRGKETKAFHHRLERVGLQESSPQNNFRRIIACRIPTGNFCNHTINYATTDSSKLDLALVLFILNSSFTDWYFRLGSTNAHVSHYQLSNLPCPLFGSEPARLLDTRFVSQLDQLLQSHDLATVEKICTKLAMREKCSMTVQHLIIRLVRYIEEEERIRGPITRPERSELSTNGARCQIVLDKLMLILLGVDSSSYDYIKQRLGEML